MLAVLCSNDSRPGRSGLPTSCSVGSRSAGPVRFGFGGISIGLLGAAGGVSGETVGVRGDDGVIWPGKSAVFTDRKEFRDGIVLLKDVCTPG